MISLTRLNNSSLTVNSDLIKFVEQSPDTVITLVNGEKILVREGVEEVMQRIIEFRRSVLQGVLPAWGQVFARSPAPPRQEEAEPAGQAER
jgi:flagellar protein FlbD